jgi:hypothetical protein
VTTARIAFNLEAVAVSHFHSLNDWGFESMWLYSSAPEDPEDDTVTNKHGADALYSEGNSFIHTIRNEDKESEQDAAHWMIQIV